MKLIKNTDGFTRGINSVTSRDEVAHNTQIDFSIVNLSSGDVFDINDINSQTSENNTKLEHACLLMDGEAIFKVESHNNGFENTAKRESLFDQDPVVVNICHQDILSIKATSDVELAIFATENSQDFAAKYYDHSNMLESEKRGYGLLNNTAYRTVRTVFDTRNHSDSNLVIGEVITFPGGWSSYPPHHHPHPEIYHYRFTEAQGYGHAELGDEVLKVKNYDTVKILDSDVHSQVAAPGYGMYYIWVIKHLDNNPYITPIFEDEHEWTKTIEANNRVWQPK